MNKNYLCSKCFKTFDRKSNFVRHINRLNPCDVERKMKGVQEEEKTKLKKYISKNFPKLNENLVAEIIGENVKPMSDKKYYCDFCNKSFQSSTYYKKHIRELCSRHIRFEQHIIRDYLKRIDKIKTENKELKEKIYYTLKTLPRYCIEEGKVINVEKNYVHFYEQKNIKPFGSEIIDHITDKFMKKMIMNPEIGIVNLIRIIHFNPDIAQNRNLFVKSQKFNSVEVYKKGGWKTIPRKDVFQNIIASKKDIMDEYFDRFCENKDIREKYINKYETFSDSLDQYINHVVFSTEYENRLKKAKTIYEKICKMINLLFLNNQKIEVTYTPEQNLKTTTEELKNIFKLKKKPEEESENKEEDLNYELYCEQNVNDNITEPKNALIKLIDKTEREVIKLIKENKLDNIKNNQSFEFLMDLENELKNDDGMDLDEDEMKSDDEEDLIITKV